MVATSISIILPSRGRPERLADCYGALKDNCVSLDDWEMIARIDKDDPQLTKYMDLAAKHSNLDCIIGDRGEGYARNDILIEEAADWSQGDIIMQYVDTAKMLTPQWDRILLENSKKSDNGVFVMFPKVLPAGSYRFSFPTISRKLYDICGCFCIGEDPSVDRCWERFIQEMKIEIHSGVEIEHIELRNTKDADQTARETNPFYKQLADHWQERVDRHIAIGKEYAEKVRRYLNDPR